MKTLQINDLSMQLKEISVIIENDGYDAYHENVEVIITHWDCQMHILQQQPFAK